MMRTTLDIPETLIEEARRLLGFKSKPDTVILGSVRLRLELDIPKSRRRPRRRT